METRTSRTDVFVTLILGCSVHCGANRRRFVPVWLFPVYILEPPTVFSGITSKRKIFTFINKSSGLRERERKWAQLPHLLQRREHRNTQNKGKTHIRKIQTLNDRHLVGGGFRERYVGFLFAYFPALLSCFLLIRFSWVGWGIN